MPPKTPEAVMTRLGSQAYRRHVKKYRGFVEKKIRLAEKRGIDVELSEINPRLKEFNRVQIRWALAGGCRALFSSFGLHKTVCQLEKARLISKHRTGAYRLIVLPLGVVQEFFSDAAEFFQGEYAVSLKFVQSDEEIGGPEHIYLTNYESVREGKVSLGKFWTSIDLDEADCLRSFGSKTFSEFLFGPAMEIPLRGVNTATPSPNDFQELLAYAHFLGVMDIGEARTRFFKRNSEKADDLTLYPHKAQEFWFWVASWALFTSRPSDLGYSDEGYALPALDVRWHRVDSATAADYPRSSRGGPGQAQLIPDLAIGVVDAAREKKASVEIRVKKLLELRAEDPDAHRLIWHDLELEREWIEDRCPSSVSVYGSQPWQEKERRILGFRNGEIQELAAKPVMLGGGCNFQKHCHWAVFLGIGFKFRDFIQAIHRLQRFGQTHTVRVDLIYTEREEKVREELERKWRDHIELVANMTAIVREFGLSQVALTGVLQRSLGVERQEAEGERFWLVNDDTVLHTAGMADNCVGLIGTSIPFEGQYEYTPAYEDFGHTDDCAHFFEQMDFLTPELFRVLKPGRVAAVHVKDRVVPGAITGLGFQTISPFHAYCLLHFLKHGFVFAGMITVSTDVVRENNGTYRLSYTQQCKDGSRMGCGMSEYILLFRKPPTDSSDGYADDPVAKLKEDYPLARWQIDADGHWRSSGNRLLAPEDLVGRSWKEIIALYREYSASTLYDFEREVAMAQALDESGDLPRDFKLLQPASLHPDVWTDVTRMRTLNTMQASRRRDKHLCPLPLDICTRLIERFSSEGDVVYDPFAGLGSFPYEAVNLGRVGWGCELNSLYWGEGVGYCRKAESKRFAPTLFDLMECMGEVEVAA